MGILLSPQKDKQPHTSSLTVRSMICNLEPTESAHRAGLRTVHPLHFHLSLFANAWGGDRGHRSLFTGQGVN